MKNLLNQIRISAPHTCSAQAGMLGLITLLCFATSAFANVTVISHGKLDNSVAATPGFAKPVYYDIDRDGVKDLISGSSYSGIYIYKNSGTTITPVFTDFSLAETPAGSSIMADTTTAQDISDWNGDGRPDLIVGGLMKTLLYTNCTIGTGVIPTFAEVGNLPALGGTTNLVWCDGNTTISIVSYDGTSSNDLLLGNNSTKKIDYYKNIGSYDNPTLTNCGALKDEAGADLTFSHGPSAILFDWDFDGTNELIVSDMANIKVFYTTNNYKNWILKKTFKPDPPSLYFRLFPFDNGNSDLFLGDFVGGIYYMENTGTVESSFDSLKSVKAASTNIYFGDNNNLNVYLWDFDGNGLTDISLRRRNSGGLRNYANTGTQSAPVFDEFLPNDYDTYFLDYFLTFESNQFFYTMSQGDSTIKICTNVGSFANPYFYSSSYSIPLEGTNKIPYSPLNSGIDVCDMNADGKLDLWYYYYGTNFWLINTNNNLFPIYKERQIAKLSDGTPIILSDSFVAPKLIDWNEDGNLDLILARYNGNISYYENISNFPPVFVSNGFFITASEGVIDIGGRTHSIGAADIDDNRARRGNNAADVINVIMVVAQPSLMVIWLRARRVSGGHNSGEGFKSP